MAEKQLARVKQAVTVKSKQMVESGQIFCASLLPEFDGNLDLMKQCQNVMNSAKNGHIAKLFTSTKIVPLNNVEVNDDNDDINDDKVINVETKQIEPVIIVVYVPSELNSKLSAEEWFTNVTNTTPESENIIIFDNTLTSGAVGTFIYGVINNDMPFKYQDILVSNSYAFIKSKGLYINDENDNDDIMYDFEY